jgi:uncharacterized protein (TIGR03790 family)
MRATVRRKLEIRTKSAIIGIQSIKTALRSWFLVGSSVAAHRKVRGPFTRIIGSLIVAFAAWYAFDAWAGGTGLNVVVVVNQNSTNSVQLGNEYCQGRGVPPQNVFRMTGWSGGAISWTPAEFQQNLRDPLLAKLISSGLTNQVQYVLLSMDIPYRVQDSTGANSTTAVLFYGFKTNTTPPPYSPDSCSLPDYSSNSFAFSEMPFEKARPNTADTNSFLTFMLTDDTFTGAQAILNRALLSDSSFPTQVVYLQKTSDTARSVRFFSFDNAVTDSKLHGDTAVIRINSDSTTFSTIRGLQTGFSNLGLLPNSFLPGALGDSLTSFAGDLFEDTGQTPLLVFLNAGSVASYGTVDEPCAYLEKFPDPLVYFYQSRGFCAAEAYYLSVLNPHQGLFVGEPLSAPFASPAQALWQGLTNGTVLRGQAALPEALFGAATTNLPVAQVDLFIDGAFVRTLTNIPPSRGDSLSVNVNSTTIPYTVTGGATLASVAADLATAVNVQSNSTHVIAAASGDRIEFQSLDITTAGSNLLLSASAAGGSGPPLATMLTVARGNFLDTGVTGYVLLGVTNDTVQGDWLRVDITKTNGSLISVSVTNATSGTNIADLCQSLINAVNATPSLQGPDGVLAGDLLPDVHLAQFLIYARSPGWPPAKLQAWFTNAPDLISLRVGTNTFEDNLTDLRPRNYLSVSAGVNELPLFFTLDTTQIPDGFHELSLIGYEGTSVRTQSRVSRTIQVQNTSLSANLTAQTIAGSVPAGTPLTVTVAANTNAIANIELFSTGGSLGAISNQQTAVFSVPTSLLGVGLHPFYALVTDAFGNQFRTQTTQIPITPPFQLSISTQPLALSWASIPGVTYDILSATNISGPFQKVSSLIASGNSAGWPIPEPLAQQSFFRVRVGQ